MFYFTLPVVLSWPEDGRSRPKHVSQISPKRNYCFLFDVCCVLTVHNIQGVPGGKDLTSGECSLGQTIPI